jgi:phospholipid/cholesterol/gamma-HCH transport system permease protein
LSGSRRWYHNNQSITMVAVIENIGQSGLDMARSFQDMLFFAGRVIIKIFDRQSYNSATRIVLVNQIYFTAVQILPLFLVGSVVFGSLLIGVIFQMITNLGLADYLGKIVMGILVVELAPLMTALLIALRSGSAINAEMAVMKVNKEINTLEVFNIDAINYLFIPRIVTGMISVAMLNSLFSVVVLVSGVLFSNLIFGMSFETYTGILLNSANLSDIILSIIKAAAFGFFVTLIPIRSGIAATDELTSIPITVLRGMVKVFIAILIIEVLSLFVRMI